MTGVLGIYDRIRNRRFDKRSQEGTIKLNDAQYKDITARAEQTASSNLMAVGSFWQGQFASIVKELEIEKQFRLKMTPRLKAHKIWDQQVTVKLEECSMHVDPPPSLDPDDDWTESSDSDPKG